MAETNTTVNSNNNNNDGAGNSNDVFYGKNAVTGTNSPDGASMGDISGISQVTGQQIQLDTSGGVESPLSSNPDAPEAESGNSPFTETNGNQHTSDYFCW